MQSRIMFRYICSIVIACLLLALAAAAGTVSAENQPVSLANRFNPDAAVIVIDAQGDHGSAGQGFFFGDGRFVATNHHCVAHSDGKGGSVISQNVYVISRHLGDVCKARVVAADPELDVAILQTPWPPQPALTLAAEQEILDTDDVMVAAYCPSGIFAKDGPYLGTDRLSVKAVGVKDRKPLLLSLQGMDRVEHGWSGSPVLSLDTGRVVGVFSRVTFGTLGVDAAADCSASRLAAIAKSVSELPQDDTITEISTQDSEQAFMAAYRCYLAPGWDQSVSYARELVSLRPFSPYAHVLLAQSAMHNKQLDLAEQHFKKAVELAPDRADVHRQYARFLKNAGREEEAAAESRKAPEPKPAALVTPEDTAHPVGEKTPDPNAIVAVTTPRGSKWVKKPGFFFDDRTVATSCQAVARADDILGLQDLKNPYVISRYLGDICEARIVAADVESDVAVLQLPWPQHPKLTLATNQEILDTDHAVVSAYDPAGTLTEGSPCLNSDRLSVRAVGVKNGKPLVLWMRDESTKPIERTGAPVTSAGTGNVIGLFYTNVAYDNKRTSNADSQCTANKLKAIAESADDTPQGGGILETSTRDSERAFSAAVGCITASDGDKSVSHARKLVELRPFSPYAHVLLGQSAMRNKEMELAEQHFRKALELAPGEPGVHREYARFLESTNRAEEASAQYQKTLDLDPSDPDGLRCYLALLLKENKLAEAEKLARRAVNEQPKLAEFWSTYSEIEEKLGKSTKAIEAAKKAAEFAPRHPGYTMSLASLLVAAGKLDEAEKQCRRLIDAAPHSPFGWMTFAIFASEYKSVKSEEGLRALDKALALDYKGVLPSQLVEQLRNALSNASKESKAQE